MTGRRLVPALVVAVLLVSGCGVSGGGVDGWPEAAVAPALAALTPPDDTCYALPPGARRKPVPCTERHTDEAFHVGLVTVDEKRDGEVAPGWAEPPMLAARTTCHKEARNFLGDDLMLAMVELKVTFPTPPQWAAGHRWFACELSEISEKPSEVSLDGVDFVERTSSLRDGLRGARPAAKGCYKVVGEGSKAKVDAVACSQPHNYEFAGLVERAAGETGKFSIDRCLPVVARYVGVPGELYEYILGWSTWYAGARADEKQEVWGCYLWTEKVMTRGSLKGVGKKARDRARIAV